MTRGESTGKEDCWNCLFFLNGEDHGGIWSQSLMGRSSSSHELFILWPQMQTWTIREWPYSVFWKEDPVNKVICQDIISLSSCDMITHHLPVGLWKLAYLSLETCTANGMSVEELRSSWSVWNSEGYQSNLPSLWCVSARHLSSLQKRGWQEMNYGLIALFLWAKSRMPSFVWALWIRKPWNSFSTVDR